MANPFAMRFYMPLVFDRLRGGRETSTAFLHLAWFWKQETMKLCFRYAVFVDFNLKERLCSILLPTGNVFPQALQYAISLKHTLRAQSACL